ncbi:MAG TPA: ArgR family transcriptional regulator [Coriobacteriia bacterium]|jgi:transcriptional regulator of arginine metabolism
MRKRVSRQEEIRKVVRRERIRTQRDLVDRLQAIGYVCTQATISRDISEMGLRKLPEGVYVLSEDLHLQRMISDLVVNIVRSDNLVLVKAQAGTASGVAAALDRAELPEVLGSIAGDDTILVIANNGADAVQLVDHLEKFRGNP